MRRINRGALAKRRCGGHPFASKINKIGSKMLREKIPLCWFNRHEPARDNVEWDGYNYVSTCRHCRAAIRRREKHRWEKDWMKAEV